MGSSASSSSSSSFSTGNRLVAMESAFVGITGASGAPYAVRLIEALVENDVFVEISASEMGEKVLAYEMGGLSTRKLAETYGVKRYASDEIGRASCRERV